MDGPGGADRDNADEVATKKDVTRRRHGLGTIDEAPPESAIRKVSPELFYKDLKGPKFDEQEVTGPVHYCGYLSGRNGTYRRAETTVKVQ